MGMRERLVEVLRAIDRDATITCPRYSSESTLENCKGCQYDKEDGSCDYAARAADYILADGWMRPPVKVGDKIYCDGQHYASHCSGRVMEFTVNCLETNVKSIFRGEVDVQFDFESFGKTVFSTREEAEKALRKDEGNG